MVDPALADRDFLAQVPGPMCSAQHQEVAVNSVGIPSNQDFNHTTKSMTSFPVRGLSRYLSAPYARQRWMFDSESDATRTTVPIDLNRVLVVNISREMPPFGPGKSRSRIIRRGRGSPLEVVQFIFVKEPSVPPSHFRELLYRLGERFRPFREGNGFDNIIICSELGAHVPVSLRMR